MYNAAQRKDVREAEKSARIAERQRHEIIKGIMSLGPGRQWMHDLLAVCHVFASSFVPDPCATAFNEGQRSIGLRLLVDIMESCPDNYILMMREETVRRQVEENKTRRDEIEEVEDDED
jgi:hypothetical protein